MKLPPLPKRIAPILSLFVLGLFLLLSCTSPTPEAEEPESDAGSEALLEVEPQVKTVGPVRAQLAVGPKAPRLGDPITLELVVEAEAGVEVIMPPFGDQLGRFHIVDFVPATVGSPDGATLASQRYTLDAPMSGRQRIPPLLVEFVDRRSDPNNEEISELLLDEVVLDIVSVLPQGALHQELRPLRPKLPPLEAELSPAEEHWPWFLFGGIALVVMIALGFAYWVGRGRVVAVDPWEFAMKRLNTLHQQGPPSAAQADAWYVELTHLVRQYIEARYGLRAPELTTEEFLRQAGASEAIKPEHRQTLRSLLLDADRVKFAGYKPHKEESAEALEQARLFLVESKPAEKDIETSPLQKQREVSDGGL